MSGYETIKFYGTLQKKVTFRNCNYEVTTELCSNTTIRRTQNYNSYYRKLQCVLRKTTGASTQHYTAVHLA